MKMNYQKVNFSNLSGKVSHKRKNLKKINLFSGVKGLSADQREEELIPCISVEKSIHVKEIEF